MHLVVEKVYRWFLAMGIAHNQMLTHLIFLLMMIVNSERTNGWTQMQLSRIRMDSAI